MEDKQFETNPEMINTIVQELVAKFEGKYPNIRSIATVSGINNTGFDFLKLVYLHGSLLTIHLGINSNR